MEDDGEEQERMLSYSYRCKTITIEHLQKVNSGFGYSKECCSSHRAAVVVTSNLPKFDFEFDCVRLL